VQALSRPKSPATTSTYSAASARPGGSPHEGSRLLPLQQFGRRRRVGSPVSGPITPRPCNTVARQRCVPARPRSPAATSPSTSSGSTTPQPPSRRTGMSALLCPTTSPKA
jgi:hypothetical protein